MSPPKTTTTTLMVVLGVHFAWRIPGPLRPLDIVHPVHPLAMPLQQNNSIGLLVSSFDRIVFLTYQYFVIYIKNCILQIESKGNSVSAYSKDLAGLVACSTSIVLSLLLSTFRAIEKTMSVTVQVNLFRHIYPSKTILMATDMTGLQLSNIPYITFRTSNHYLPIYYYYYYYYYY